MVVKKRKKVTHILLLLSTALLWPMVVLAAEPPPAPDQAPAPTSPTFSKATQGYEVAIFKTLGILLLLLALVFLTVWLLRRLSQGRFRSFNQFKSIKILEKRPLSPKSILYLVEVHGKKLLVSESQCEVRSLATIAEPPQKDL